MGTAMMIGKTQFKGLIVDALLNGREVKGHIEIHEDDLKQALLELSGEVETEKVEKPKLQGLSLPPNSFPRSTRISQNLKSIINKKEKTS